MSYISSTKDDAYLGGFGCGPGCGCAPCRSGGNLSEWYERDDDDDEPVKPAPKSAPAQVSPPPPRLSGWGRPGLGFYGRLGFFSQAPAFALPALVHPQVTAQLPAAGPGFYTYYATDARGRLDSPPGYHRYALPVVVRALQSIAAEWHRLHPLGPRIGFGDLSLLGGGPTPRHGAHRSGLEADIRPLRTDGRELPVTYTDPGYSRAHTQEVVDLIRRNPVLRVRVILFNDSGVRGVTSFAGHNNHLHVGFLPPGTTTRPAASGPSQRPTVPGVTVAMVSQMFPGTPVANIEANLPFVLKALADAGLGDKAMILMALATIRAETGNFTPLSEMPSRFNTPPGGPPFSLYDNRRDLGNQGPPDGVNFRGRGYIQLTGRSNYRIHGAAIGLGNQLITNPALANQPNIAAKLLASFLKSKEQAIRNALRERNLAKARKLVNGGSHGLQAFTAAYNIGTNLIP